MRRLLLLVAVLLLALPAAPAAAQGEAHEVLVVGAPGLRWSDVGAQTPVLEELARSSAVGALSVKAVPALTCPADGWLTLGAGNRAEAANVQRDPCTAEIPRPATFAAQVAENADQQEGADLGALASALGRCIDAQGEGPVLAATVQAGRGVVGEPFCPVVLRELPPVTGEATPRAQLARAADRELGRLLRDTLAETVLVVGLSAGPGEDDPSLHVALARGPAYPPGALRSASTRRAPYVQLVDVAPTVLELLDVPAPASMVGQPWRSVGAAPTPAELADLALRARAHKAVTVPFFVALLAAQLALVVVFWRRRPDLAELVALGGVVALGASYLANLVPWWRSPAPLLTLLAVVVLISTAAVGAIAWATSSVIFRRWLPTRRPAPPSAEDHRGVGGGGGAAAGGGVGGRRVLVPVGLACAFTAGVILVDLVTGAHLQMSSVAGYSPLVAGRFAGVGNVAFGVLAASVLLATAALTRRALVVAAVGAVAVVVDGAPPWGSDVGGVLALVPAFVLLALLVGGRRVTLPRLAGAAVAGALVVTAFALADWSRSATDRTHLGRFVQDVADGTAGTLLRRKADAVLGLLFANPLTALLPLVVAAAVYLVVRPPAPLARAFEAAPAWRHGLTATGLAAAVGFVVNDSGAAVPALALVVAIPATTAVILRARRGGDEPPSLLA